MANQYQAVTDRIVAMLEAGTRLAFFAPTAGEVERLADMFSEYALPYRIDLGGERVPEYLQMRAQSLSSGIALIRGDVARGTVFQEGRLAIFGAEDLFEASEIVAKPGKSHLGTFSADQFDLKPGDYVVHAEHGVGQFHGVREIAQPRNRTRPVRARARCGSSQRLAHLRRSACAAA